MTKVLGPKGSKGIEVISAKNRGSTFKFILQLWEDKQHKYKRQFLEKNEDDESIMFKRYEEKKEKEENEEELIIGMGQGEDKEEEEN